MSDIQSLTPFRLEECPDEIVLEIFKYVQPIDLHSFTGHNLRINNIVRDTKLNVVIQYPEDEEDLNYLKTFLPNQFIRLELRYTWDAFDINAFEELRSLTLDCDHLSEYQLDQLLNVNLVHLERFSIDNVPHCHAKQLFYSIVDNEHFPTLKVCQFSGEFYHLLELGEDSHTPNHTIRTLIVNKWVGSQLDPLFNLLPNLRRFETKFSETFYLNVHHTSLEYLRLVLEDPFDDLEKILQCTPNLKQLRVTGKITEDSALMYFEKLAKIFRSQTHNVRKFDCELYFHAWNAEVDVIVIQQLHPLFKKIECHQGNSINQCYATDLTEYPPFSDYSCEYKSFSTDKSEAISHKYDIMALDVEPTRSYAAQNWGVMGGYDSDRDDYDRHYDDQDDDDNNSFVDYGLGYHGNYKANYGSSPWGGNNDDD